MDSTATAATNIAFTNSPANAATHFYRKSVAFNPFSVVAVLYSTLAEYP
jgi:hypothetical protein